MNGSSGAPGSSVPTLTEVVSWPAQVASAPMPLAPAAEALPLDGAMPDAPAVAAAAASASVQAAADAPTPAAPPAELPSQDQLTHDVLADLQRQIELMLDYRMREVLTPILTRATDSVIREARTELASTLRDVVARAVAQELARRRPR